MLHLRKESFGFIDYHSLGQEKIILHGRGEINNHVKLHHIALQQM